MLNRALASVVAQTKPPEAIVVAVDHTRAGAAATRNVGLASVRTPWVAFLDSDDELDPDHLEQLLTASDGADLVYPWFRVVGYVDPWPGRCGLPFDEAALRARTYNIPIAVLARTEAVRAAGGFIADLSIAPPAECEEWPLWLRMLDRGAVVRHLPTQTWTWHAHGGNTSGSARLGDAKRSNRSVDA
jgi:hypothetical protein